MVHALPPLSDWGNFYVITGSAAAALTGLRSLLLFTGIRNAWDSAVWIGSGGR